MQAPGARQTKRLPLVGFAPYLSVGIVDLVRSGVTAFMRYVQFQYQQGGYITSRQRASVRKAACNNRVHAAAHLEVGTNRRAINCESELRSGTQSKNGTGA